MAERERPTDAIAKDAEAAWLERSSISFLECAIHLMMTHMSKARVCQVLRQEARMIEELD